MNKPLLLVLLLIANIANTYGQQTTFSLVDNDKTATVVISPKEDQVVHTALELLIKDVQEISSATLQTIKTNKSGISGNVIIGTIGKSPVIKQLEKSGAIDLTPIRNQWESFILKTINLNGQKRLVVIGSDSNGTAYGVLEISRLIGVSPWHFFADVPVPQKESIALPDVDICQQPSVQYRGIFINDEDWGMLPWASETYDPDAGKGVISSKVHERIFELLLRLRANTFWPAMHECSVPFYMIPGNREMAGKYGIYIGSSHCEPMACNVNGEWKMRGKGDYDYTVNRENVRRFWEQRVKETAEYNTIYTLGMRGVHDGAMQGAKTLEDQKKVLETALADQRAMLSKQVNKNLPTVPQVFIPYKEVLDIYNHGLEVPEDVTLMWCDDNYGYIRHFPTPEEQARKGGNGVYYHVSYWGRPHDYLWLATTHPALVFNQMRTAYDRGIRKMWILNVGDIKPTEYLTELFLDMAWNIDQVTLGDTNNHLTNWITNTFNPSLAQQVTSILNEYYRLAYIRKPEFMGNTRVEEKDPAHSVVRDLPWTETEIKTRLTQYDKIAQEIKKLSADIPSQQQSAWYQLVEYPVLASNEMNKKHLYAQLARHKKADWKQSEAAFDSIVTLTRQYNQLENGKWNRIMDYQPRKLSVFQSVAPSTDVPMTLESKPIRLFNGTDYSTSHGKVNGTNGLGYQSKAISLSKGSEVTYEFDLSNRESVSVELRLLPNHPVESNKLRVLISTDNGATQIPVDYQTYGRSEEWKLNVLGNQAIRKLILPLDSSLSKHRIKITVLDEGVVLDQIIIG